MSREKNKINFGLTRLAWAPITEVNGVDTYGAPRVLEGARSLSASKLGEMFTEYADGRRYFRDRTNTGYNITTELVLADHDFRAYILSEELDGKNVQVEYNETKVKRFALLCEFLGDDHKGRRVFYDCYADRPDISFTTANDGDSKSSYREQINIISNPRINDGAVTAFSRADTDEQAYAQWFNTVYQPEGSGYAPIEVTVTDNGEAVIGALVSDSAGNQAKTDGSGVAVLYELPDSYEVFVSYKVEDTIKSGSASCTLTSSGARVSVALS